MCYWYADSTFEVLCEIGQAKIINSQTAKKKGIFSYKGTNYIAYTGVTRQSLKEAGLLVSDQGLQEEDVYKQKMVDLQADLNKGYAHQAANLSKDENPLLSEEDLESISQNGWNVARYLDMIQTMPTHQTLLDDSRKRAQDVRQQLLEIQSGREAAGAKARRETEAKLCLEKEEEMRQSEAKWKREMEKNEAKLAQIKDQAEKVKKNAAKDRERADNAERLFEEAKKKAAKDEERAERLTKEVKKALEGQKRAERLFEEAKKNAAEDREQADKAMEKLSEELAAIKAQLQPQS